ncbi:4-carboxymuconolactone decarboxylase [Roseomonas sp. CCTCC AB2023176]|uniref:bifunctional 3-oxoadipate enol-lactonase/4-carboxymuconolactone decarboxylase PcaDC n=1 Tax=Roseomonas sp. CCTCC AB2023176 TaxID=3342640 RepID=UPI0035D7A012
MFVRVNDLSVHVQEAGPPGGPPVLMLHSLGTNLHVWDPQAAALARTHRVIRADLRGHGLTSGHAAEETSMAELAADAAGLLDALGITAAHLAGVSIGGRIAMELAAIRPERVLSLFLLDTAMEFPPPETWSARMQAVRAGGMSAVADGVLTRWVVDGSAPAAMGLSAMLLATSAGGYAACAAALRDARAEPLRGRLRGPATVVVGELDLASPIAAAQAIRDAIPGSSLTVIPGAAHIPNFEFAEAVTDALLRHFAAPVDDPHAAGMAVRKSVLGEAHVARAQANVTPLDSAFQDYITRNVWGQIWTRPGLPRHVRSLLTLAVTAALGREGEFGLHVRATRNTGVTPEEIAEVLLQVGAYAGVPAANHALKIAKEILSEMEKTA